MSDRFKGGDELTKKDGLKYFIHEAIMHGKLNVENKAYGVSNVQVAADGISFGPIQYDLSANNRGRALFESIASSANDGNGIRIISEAELMQIKKSLYKPVSSMTIDEKAFYNQLKTKIDKALGSPDGRSQIDADYARVLDDKVVHVKNVIDGVTNPASRAYLHSDLKAQVMIEHIGSQSDSAVNVKFKEFLNQTSEDPGVKLHGEGKLVKVASSSVDASDIHNFGIAAAHAVKDPTEAKRRHDDAVTVVPKEDSTRSTIPPTIAHSLDATRKVDTVTIGKNQQFTVAHDPTGTVPAMIFRSPEMTPPPLATLEKTTFQDKTTNASAVITLNDIVGLLESGVLVGKGTPITPIASITPILPPTLDGPAQVASSQLQPKIRL